MCSSTFADFMPNLRSPPRSAASPAWHTRHARRAAGASCALAPRIRRQKCSVQCDIADVATCHVEPCQLAHIQPLGRGVLREDAPPDLGALLGVWERELHDEAY